MLTVGVICKEHCEQLKPNGGIREGLEVSHSGFLTGLNT